jgi:ribosomal protein S18 acetylase RimI-like enzyme
LTHPDSPIEIRPAVLDDIPQLCNLLAILFSQEADFQPDPDRQSRALRLILEQPHVGFILCAAESHCVIAMVSILFTVSTAEGGRAGVLEDMIVHPASRGQRIGERLLHEALRLARKSGCSRVTLLTDGTNESAIRFYSRAGFTPSRMIPLRVAL